MQRSTYTIALCLLVLLLSAGCDSDSGSEEDALEGTWESTSGIEEVVYLEIDLPLIDIYIFEESLNCYFTSRLTAERTSGDTYEVTDEEGEIFVSMLRVEDDVLTIEEDGDVVTFRRSSTDVGTLSICLFGNMR